MNKAPEQVDWSGHKAITWFWLHMLLIIADAGIPVSYYRYKRGNLVQPYRCLRLPLE